ncbi:hypothetical protein Metev_0635 [Methanohalobium evestigatum Z-7303]|uniref:Uncharacterized protein n=1 Tax=Methanohalobium evestigatum (strain ATCC BAA-1072 / DSM 3721 / NBRC 107634 / OCM 161 / Z-7303) TaxID=644295 RepID=D7E8J9_METEZ|nr:hypothetical protein [Methanohalobium evestigatum]ADI73541.1 hypothetical protein Metev_0635 [Methanohalobium evestigatum Z-7303]
MGDHHLKCTICGYETNEGDLDYNDMGLHMEMVHGIVKIIDETGDD